MDGVFFVRSFIRNFYSFSLFSFFFYYSFSTSFFYTFFIFQMFAANRVFHVLSNMYAFRLDNESNPIICRSPFALNEITSIDFTVPTVFISDIAEAKAFSFNGLSFNKFI